ncbi:hypothetical protein [Lishizhenia sp.]|uniref:hypothetical protein n=1 Tax=Lishizhenia sp. TaxID=2497594 RepID=UPI00299D90D2|nr:hypothetical protein [Lishizhenia sp.]MDX1445085.1 hypothetical protein [Lishizhenia sp.]
MSLTDKDIDQLFREAANSAPQVEFKDAYWDEMNAFLDQEEKSKRGIYSMLSVGILALIGIGSLLLIPNQNKYDNSVVAEKLDTFVSTPDNIVALKAAKLKENTSKQEVKTAFNKKEARNSITSVNGEKKSILTTQSAVENTNKQVSIKEDKPENFTSPFISAKETSKNEKLSAIAIPEKEITQVQKLTTQETNTNTNKVDVSENVSPKPVLLKPVADPFANFGKSIERLHVDDQGPLSQTFNPNADLSNLLDFKNLQRLKDRMYVELGVGISDNYNSSIAGRSFVYNGALNYEFRKNWLRVRAGIGANLTTNANITYTTDAKIYDFGSRNSSNELVYKELYDLYLPLEIGASFKKVSFGVGFKYNFLNHSRAEFRTYQDGALDEEGVYYGLTEGLKQNTSSAYFFVERNLFSRVDLGIKMGTYLNSRATFTEQLDMVGPNITPKYGFVYLKYNFRK